MFLNRKKFFASMLLLLSLVVISWFILFEYSVRWFEKSIDLIVSNLRQKGYTVSYSKVQITGNPFFLRVIFQNPHIKDPRGLLEWQGPELELRMRPWSFYTFRCVFPGEQKVYVPQDTPIPLGVLHFKGTEGTFTLSSQGMLAKVDVTVDRLSSFIGTQPQPVFLYGMALKVKNVNDPTNLELLLTTNVFNLEKLLNLETFDHPLTVNLEAHLSGYQDKNSFPKSLAEWRDGGGVIDVDLLKITWAPLIVEAEGTLTLDKGMYPLGSFSSKIIAYQDALADMVKLGWVKKKNAASVSFMLELFSAPDEVYGRKLTIPITLQNKSLSIGPAKLMKLKPLTDI